MNYTKQYLAELSSKTNFIKDNLEKVLRLSEILRFFNSDPYFRGKLALKGGTAINLTSVELPRLSVDIDLDFTRNLAKEEIEEAKSEISKKLADYMWQEGYSLNAEPRKHYALLSFAFAYTNSAGNKDGIKVEINFMDRCHVLPLEYKGIKAKGVVEGFDVLALSDIELYASKINALLSRATPRDLYDVNAMINGKIIEDDVLLRKCLIFYNMVGGERDIDEVSFENIERINFAKFRSQLRPVLAKNDKFDLDEAKANVIGYLKALIKIEKGERRFIEEFRNKNYRPELLFDDQTIIGNIKSHPMALWRCPRTMELPCEANDAEMG